MEFYATSSPEGARVRLIQEQDVPNPAGNYAEAPEWTKRLQIRNEPMFLICFLLVIPVGVRKLFLQLLVFVDHLH